MFENHMLLLYVIIYTLYYYIYYIIYHIIIYIIYVIIMRIFVKATSFSPKLSHHEHLVNLSNFLVNVLLA